MQPGILSWSLIGSFKKHLENLSLNVLETFRDAHKKLNFYYLKKHIPGKPDPRGSLHLLVRCKICGQINPTGMGINRELIREQSGAFRSGSNNSWNYYTRDDLLTLGLCQDGMSDYDIDSLIKNTAVLTPQDQKHFPVVIDCYTECINCQERIEFSSKDLFL
jgi:hypothetical protein